MIHNLISYSNRLVHFPRPWHLHSSRLHCFTTCSCLHFRLFKECLGGLQFQVESPTNKRVLKRKKRQVICMTPSKVISALVPRTNCYYCDVLVFSLNLHKANRFPAICHLSLALQGFQLGFHCDCEKIFQGKGYWSRVR